MPLRLTMFAAALAIAVSAGAQSFGDDVAPAKPRPKDPPPQAQAKPQPAPQAPASNGLGDDDIEQRRSLIDGKLAARTAKLKQSLDRAQAFQLGEEKERVDFERYMAEERKAFLTYLKSVKDQDRRKTLGRFDDKQEKERLEFDKRQNNDQKDWFRERIDKPWKTDSLEMEAAETPVPAARPAPEPARTEMPEAPKKPAHPYVYRKPKKPSVRRKPAPSKAAQAKPAAAAPAAAAPSPDAPAPPSPGN